jgi:hypothetical protein
MKDRQVSIHDESKEQKEEQDGPLDKSKNDDVL